MEEELDLFSCTSTLPKEVQDILEKYSEDWDDTYENCSNLLSELEALGFTFEYGLDAVPFNLKKI